MPARLQNYSSIYRNIQRIVETRLLKGEDGDGLIRPDGSIGAIIVGVPTFYEGRDFTQPPNGWTVLSIVESGSAGRGFSRNLRKTSGTIRLKIVSAHGAGTSRIRGIADVANARLSFTGGASGITHQFATGTSSPELNNALDTSTLHIKPGLFKRISDDDDGYLNYVLEWSFDYYTS